MFAIFTLPWQLGDLVPVPHNHVRHPGMGGGGGVHSHFNCNKLNKTNEVSAEMSRKLKKIAEYPFHQLLICLYRQEIHVALSNINMDVRILFQGQFV